MVALTPSVLLDVATVMPVTAELVLGDISAIPLDALNCRTPFPPHTLPIACKCPGSVTVEVAVCVWLGKEAFALPPVAFTAYVEPAPTTNLSRRSGVLDAPLHNSQPLGIEAALPDQIIIMPATNADCIVGKAPAPLLVNTCPVVPTATDWTAAVEVVPPHRTPYAVVDVTPVPPFATATVPETLAAFPVMLMPQVPEAPEPVGEGTSVPIARPNEVLAAEAEVAAVPPLAIGNAVPDKVTASVPEVVTGDPEIDKNVGTDIATEVTVPLVAGAAQDGAPLVVAVKTCPVVPLAIAANPVPALLPV